MFLVYFTVIISILDKSDINFLIEIFVFYIQGNNEIIKI